MAPCLKKTAMKHLLFGFLFFMTSVVFSQHKDVLSNKEYLILQDKVKALGNSNIDSAFIVANRIEKSNNPLHKAFAIGIKSYLFQINGDSINSKYSYKLALNYLNKVPSGNEKTKLHAYLLSYGGLADWKRSNFGNALEKYQEGKKLSEKAGDLIQVVKFNNNIAFINSEVGNYKLAISACRESDKFTDNIEYLYSKDQFIRNKSNINFNLGTFYEGYYVDNKSKKYLLDSAEYYFKKTLKYSKDLNIIKINTKIHLGNIYYQKNDLIKAKHAYEEVLFIAKDEENLAKEYYGTVYNLGDLCYTLKKYNEALLCFQKVDSIYEINKTDKLPFINSNYYQAKIYNIFKNADKASEHSRIYIDNFEKNGAKLNDETFKVNLKLNHAIVKNEMIDIQNKYKFQMLSRNFLVGFLIVFIIAVFFIKNKMDKKKADQKVNAIIEEYKLNQDNIITELSGERGISGIEGNNILYQSKKEPFSINMDEEKEKEIINKLVVLENKLYYLKPDFTQQAVAKKIKTNTTYLSYVVNKKFNKTFSEYSNELKINYAINEMLSNPIYRKYSTQAIAESVGFKNAVSFTKSFNKRTGVTPVQFVKRLEIQEPKG